MMVSYKMYKIASGRLMIFIIKDTTMLYRMCQDHKYIDEGLGAGVVGCLTVYLPLLWGMTERYSKLLISPVALHVP